MSDPIQTQDFDSSVPATGPDTIRSLDTPAQGQPDLDQGEPQGPQGPSWGERNSAYQKRTAAERRVSGRYRDRLQELEGRFETSTSSNNELLRQAIAALQRQGAGQAQEEQVPDPQLQPVEFAAWMKKQIAEGSAGPLAKISEMVESQRAQAEQYQQQRQREELAAAQSQQEAEWLQQSAYEYESQAPDVSHGHEDRFHTVRDGIVTPAFQSMGHTPEESAHLANSLYRLIAQGEARGGRNPIAAIDAFNSQLVMSISERLGMPMVPISMDGGGGEPSYQYQPQPQAMNPQQAEIQRLEVVRRRSAPAGNAGPRMAARNNTQRSEVAQLFAAGIHLQPGGYTKIQQAALRETGGDGQRAAILMQQYG